MTSYDTFQPPREVDGRWAEYKSSLPERRLDAPARDTRDVAQLVQRSVERRAGRYRLRPEDVEDVRQEVMIGILAAQKRRGGRALTVEEDEALIRHITRTVLSKGTGPAMNYRDRKALGVFREEIAQLELSGVTVDKRVRDELAADIRNRAEPGDRPKEGFHEPPRVMSLETPIGEDDLSLGDTIVAENLDAGHASDDSPAAHLLAARLNGEASPADARREVWDAIAQTQDATRAVPASLSGKKSTAARKTVDGAGGVLAAARAWEAGELDDKVERALFAPFGAHATNRDLASVTRVLTSYPDYADELWSSAMNVARHRPADGVGLPVHEVVAG